MGSHQPILDDTSPVRELSGPLTTTSAAARQAFARAVAGLLEHRRDVTTSLREALAEDAELVAAHAVFGLGLCTLGDAAQNPEIRRALRSGQEGLERRGGTDGERALVRALEAWSEDQVDRAAEVLDGALRDAPQDRLLMKLAHATRFMMGDTPGMLRSLKPALDARSAEHPGFGFVLGCSAFALEESGALERAEHAGREALDLEPSDAWAAHAVSHVMLAFARHREGADWLAASRRRLVDLGNFQGHLAWHEALFRLELDEDNAALELLENVILPHLDRDYRDLCNASTLLCRLERRGVDVRTLWPRLADWAFARKGRHALAFADLHAVLALSAAGRVEQAREFIDSMARTASRQSGFAATVTREVGVPLAREMVREPTAAPDALDNPNALTRLGGSHAQREALCRAALDVRRRSDRSPSTQEAGS